MFFNQTKRHGRLPASSCVNVAILTVAVLTAQAGLCAQRAQAQDLVLEAAQDAARLARPIIFAGQGGARLYDPVTKKDRLANAGNGAVLSNNARLVAFGSYDGGKRRIWVGDLEGKNRPLTDDHAPNYLRELAFSPNDRYVAYQIQGHTVGKDVLYLLDLKQGRHWQITPEDMASLYFSWSPDGSQLALGMVFDQQQEVFSDMLMVHRKMDIVILDITTRQFRKLTNTGEEIDELAWSPDGKWIAYKTGGGLKLVSAEPPPANLDGGAEQEPRLLLEYVSKEGSPRWAPDSKSIAVSRHANHDNGTKEQIIVVPLEGEPRSYEFKHQVWYYDFSPNDDSIVLTTDDRNLTQLNLTTNARTILAQNVDFWAHVTWSNQR